MKRKFIIIFGILAIIIVIVALFILFPKKKEVGVNTGEPLGFLNPSRTGEALDLPSSPIPGNGGEYDGQSSPGVSPTPFPSLKIITQVSPPSAEEKAVYEANTRDAERIANITMMAGVLLSYVGEQADSNNYPSYPVASGWINLSDADNSVVKKLNKIAADSLVNMPKVFVKKDPFAPNFYYAYRSINGKTCEVSIQLEAKSSLYESYCSPLIADKCVYVYKVVRPQIELPVGSVGGES